jgi:hypothetical protein
MSLPGEHLDHLERSLHQHQDELQVLEGGPDKDKPAIRARIEFHKIVLRIGRDKKVRSLLGELYDNPLLIDELAKDSKEFLKARGVTLPPGAGNVVAVKRAPDSIMAGINFRAADQDFSLLWDKKGGFGARMVATEA